MKKVSLSLLLALSLMAAILALVSTWWDKNKTLPQEIHLAAGAKGGQYYQLATLLKERFDRITGHQLVLHETKGSNDNFKLLKNNKVDLAILQLGPLGIEDYELITPLYPEMVQVIVKANSAIHSIAELAGKQVAISSRGSGMYSSALQLLDHEALTGQVKTLEQYITTIETDNRPDGIIATAGLLNSDLTKLMQSGNYRLLEMPHAEGMALRQPFFSLYTVPQGFYRGGAKPVPAKDIETIGTMAILVGGKGISDDLINAVLKGIFETDMNYRMPVLLNKQQAYEWSLYPKHPVARAYFNPYEGIDLVASMMEALSAGKELIVALFAGLYLLWQTWNQRKKKKLEEELSKQKEHLDTYLDKTIAIERGHINVEDPEILKAALEEVTRVKLEALQEFTSEELRADQAFQIFLTQCANLSRKLQNSVQYETQERRHQ